MRLKQRKSLKGYCCGSALGTCVFMCVVQVRERECSTGVSGISISTVAAGLLLAVCLKCSLTFHCLNTDLFSSPFIINLAVLV